MSLSDEEQGYFSDADLVDGDDEEGGYNNELEEGDDGTLAMTNKKNSEGELRSFKTLSSADLEEEIRRKVNDVMAVLELEYEIASVLLRHFRWNKERLLEDYMDSPDSVLYDSGGGRPSSPLVEPPPPVPEEPPSKKKRTAKSRTSDGLTAVRSSLRLSAKAVAKTMKALTSPEEPKPIIVSKNDPSTSTSDYVTSSGTTMCEICCDTPSDPSSTMYRPRCGHSFCKPCWSDYARGKVEDDRVINVTCMQEGCKTVLLESELNELLDEHTFARYRQLVQDSYVLQDKSIKFCPFPACNHALRSKHKVDQTSILTIVPIATCTPSLHTFCFNCETQGDHRPLICTLSAKWTSHVNEDAGSVSWIIANTKVCPKCQKPVEKNGGCNHMSCSQCHASWCWGCGQLQKNCGGQCHRFKADDVKATSDIVNRSRVELEKWLFYYDRFMNHEKSTKLEKELVARIEDQITSIVNISEMSWIEARFLQHAVDILMKCRETLKWSYGMAYYLESGNMKVLFEDLQGELERAVEELSHLLEENFTADSIRDLRLKIINKAAYVQKQHQLMLKDVEEGFKEGRWEWIVSVS